MRSFLAAATHYCKVCGGHFCNKCAESHAKLWNATYLIEIEKGENKDAPTDR